MSERLYDMMDWPEIEAVVYSEESEPKRSMKTAERKKFMTRTLLKSRLP